MRRFIQFIGVCGLVVGACSASEGDGGSASGDRGGSGAGGSKSVLPSKPIAVAGDAGSAGVPAPSTTHEDDGNNCQLDDAPPRATPLDDAYDCELDNAPPKPTPIDQVPANGTCSPAAVVDAFRSGLLERGSPTDFLCGEFGELEVVVGEPTAATLRTGVFYNDESLPDEPKCWPCVALSVDVPIRVVSLAGGEPFELTSVKTDHICWNSLAEGTRSDGATAVLSKEATRALGLSISRGGKTVSCTEHHVTQPFPFEGVAGDDGIGTGGYPAAEAGGAGGYASSGSGGEP